MAARLLRKHLVSRYLRPSIYRFFSSEASVKCSGALKCTQLRNRGLLKIEGKDAIKCLQGLLTNDVQLFHIDDNWNAMYAMFLNSNGRVLYDVIFYKCESTDEVPSFLVECDKSASQDIMKHLKTYKLRAKVNISGVEDLVPWVVFSSKNPFDLKKASNPDVHTAVKDPRLGELGFRVVLPRGCLVPSYFEDVHETDDSTYKVHRAKLGVCEGVEEISPGNALPLEYNVAYLKGVSFNKGCYLGQELTARTFHTGVIRKRVMPFTIEGSTENIKVQAGSSAVTSKGKKAGKVCAVHGQYGMGVLRLETVKNADKMFLQDDSGNSVEISVHEPPWWPIKEHDHI